MEVGVIGSKEALISCMKKILRNLSKIFFENLMYKILKNLIKIFLRILPFYRLVVFMEKQKPRHLDLKITKTKVKECTRGATKTKEG